MPPNASLDARDHRLVELLVAGLGQDECARQLGCHRKTVWRRRQRPAFQAALHSAEQEHRRTQLRLLAASAMTATRYLAEVMTDTSQDTRDRMTAAGTLLSKWAALEPHRLDARVAVATTAASGPTESLTEHLQRLRQRMLEDDPELLSSVSQPSYRSPNGNSQEAP
jgi:IS30 family transposase